MDGAPGACFPDDRSHRQVRILLPDAHLLVTGRLSCGRTLGYFRRLDHLGHLCLVAVADALVEHFLTLPKDYPQITDYADQEQREGTARTNRDNPGRAAYVLLRGF